MNNNSLKNTGGLPQLLFLCLLSLSGLILGAFISFFLATSMGESVQSPDGQSLLFIRLSQIITTVCWLLIPSSLYIAIFHGDSSSYLKLDKKQSVLYIILAIVLVVVIQPTVEFLSYLNELIVFPDSLRGLETTFKEWRDSSESIIQKLIADKSLLGIVSNLFVIAVLAAFVEEIFFRGCLQQIFLRIVKNKHIAVWITATIFSAVHFDFYGFLPRVLLGAILGYLFVWSGTLWISIIFHFVNNSLSIIVQQIYYGTAEYDKLDNFNLHDDFIYVALSILFTFLIVYILRKKVRVKN